MSSPHKSVAARWLYILSSVLMVCANTFAAETDDAKGGTPQVYFIAPQNGDVVDRSFRVVMGLRGMGVAPAGVDRPNTGHHHLIINAPAPPPGEAVPSDDNHLHFGKGQTETVLTLEPGSHTLQLVLGDFAHRPHDPPVVSERIRITVRE